LSDDLSWEQGSCSIANPLTCVALLDKCKEHRAKAVIQTGAASACGKMMVKLLGQNGIPVINVVRRQE